MKSLNQSKEMQLETRRKSMVVLWVASIFTIGLYWLFSVFSSGPEPEKGPVRFIAFLFPAIGIGLALISIIIRRRYLKQAEERQAPALVQTGFVVSIALCDAIGLLGILDHFVTGNQYYFIMFAIAVIAIVFHFPRRQQWAIASYRSLRQDN
jgi:hypothetical protein